MSIPVSRGLAPALLAFAALGAAPAAARDAAPVDPPLAFEDVRGHDGSPAEFLARGRGYALWLTPTEAVFALRGAASTTPATLRMQIVGGVAPAARGTHQLPGVIRQYIGNDPRQWHTDATYAEVRYDAVYPGIDLVYHGNAGRLEYDFVVAPGAAPARIGLAFAGARSRIAEDGGLALAVSGGGELRWAAPVAYQTIDGVRHPVTSRYTLSRGGAVGFAVGAYDRTRPLVIDPTIAWSTFLGGSESESGNAVVVDASGNAYTTGFTFSPNFPGLGMYRGLMDVYVAKFDSIGKTLLYAGFFGGAEFEQGNAIALDGAGNIYVTGNTSSPLFPTTFGAYDTTYNGGTDVFVLSLSSTGVLRYSTFLGTDGEEFAHGIAIDDQGRPYVVGETSAATFPTTTGAYDTSYNGGTSDVFVTRLAADLGSLSYSTFLGGSLTDQGNGIVLDGNKAYVVGTTTSSNFPTTASAFDRVNNASDAFVSELSADGGSLLASTYLGGTADDGGQAIARGGLGQFFVTGWTRSTNYPTTAGAYDIIANGGSDAFVTKLNAGLSALTYSTYLGGPQDEVGYSIAVNDFAGAWVTGTTTSITFPQIGSTQIGYAGGTDAFVTRVLPAGTGINFSTCLGGNGFDAGLGIALDPTGNAWVTGVTVNGTFPVTALSYDTTYNGLNDAFLVRYDK